jgi:hypothetical protein
MVVVGADVHKRTHTFVAVNEVGRQLVSGYDLTCRYGYDLTCRSRQGDHGIGSPPATRVRRSLRR